MISNRLYVILALLLWGQYAYSENKYSAEMNKKLDHKSFEKPFRMNKVNLLWEKAQKRLGPEKLKSLYSDLKIQDKDEMKLKQLKAEGEDREGLKEAALRKRFRAVMGKYDLGEHLEQVEETIRAKKKQSGDFNEVTEVKEQLFQDSKLNKLWDKVEKSGFSKEELKMLQEELSHHQEKLDEYHELKDEASRKAGEVLEYINNYSNDLEPDVLPLDQSVKEKRYKEATQLLKEKHEELRKSHDKISKLTIGISDSDFEEIKVQELWNLAQGAKFNADELESLKEELRHYEHRVKKLKHLQTQIDFDDVNGNKWLPENKLAERKHVEQRIKQYNHKVDKIHAALEMRIMQRHLEL